MAVKSPVITMDVLDYTISNHIPYFVSIDKSDFGTHKSTIHNSVALPYIAEEIKLGHRFNETNL